MGEYCYAEIYKTNSVDPRNNEKVNKPITEDQYKRINEILNEEC